MSRGFSTGLGRYAVGPAKPLIALVEQSASRLMGRELDLTFGDARAHVCLRSLRFAPTAAGMMSARLDAVDVELENVRWDGGRLDELLLRVRQGRVLPGMRPVLVAGPIDVTARLRQLTLDDWLARAGVEWGVTLAANGSVEVTWPGRERLGHAVVTVHGRGDVLRLVPEEVVVRGRRVRAPVRRFARPLAFTLPPLPGGARLLRVVPHENVLEVRAVVDEVREPISTAQLLQLRRALDRLSGTQLVLPRITRGL